MEWITFDTTTFFAAPPVTEMERESWTRKPRVAPRRTPLTARPVVQTTRSATSSRPIGGPVLVDAGWDDDESWAAVQEGFRVAGADVADCAGVLVEGAAQPAASTPTTPATTSASTSPAS